MLCEELMKRDVETTSPDETVEMVARKMRDSDVGFLPVCNESTEVVGTITDRDIVVRIVAAGASFQTPVGDVMTEDVIGCQPTDDVQRAEQLMSENRVSRIMCLDDDGRLLGVISLSDIAEWEQESDRTAGTLREISMRETHAPH